MQHSQQTEKSPVSRKYAQRTRPSASAFQYYHFFRLRLRTTSASMSLASPDVCSQPPWVSSALFPGAATLPGPRGCTENPPIMSVLRRTSTTWIVECTQRWRARCGSAAVPGQRPKPLRIERRATRQRVPLLATGVESPDASSTTGAASRRVGLQERLYLLAVPLIWSTYSPSMRFLFQLADVSPSAALLNLGPALCGALGFLVLFLIRRWGERWFPKQREHAAQRPAQHAVGIRIGIELGVYMFVGTCLQLLALQFSPASQVGFLLQVSLVFTALLQRCTERRRAPAKATGSLRYSGTIVCNLLGTALLILDDNPDLLRGKLRWHPPFAFIDGYGLPPSRLIGQLCALAAAMLYALFTVRLSDERIRTSSAFTVASAKTTTLAALSVLWFFVRPDWRADRVFFTETGRAGVIAYTLSAIWNGIFGTSLTTWFQVQGQGAGRVSATEAGIVYATSPLWGALLSMVFLHERMGSLGWTGAALIFLSMVALNLPSPQTNQDADRSASIS